MSVTKDEFLNNKMEVDPSIPPLKTIEECRNEARLKCNPILVNWIDGCRMYLYDELFDSEQEPMNEIQINLLFIQIHYLEELLRNPAEINKFNSKSELYDVKFN